MPSLYLALLMRAFEITRCRWIGVVAIVLAQACVRGADPLLITEFMAVNESTLKDDTGDYSDWIEICNAGTNGVNLKGYALTDEVGNLGKWRFPATNLAAGRALLVFASGLDRAIPGKPLHTNFKLDAQGEYLALVGPDETTVLSEFAPAFPPQQRDRSFGLAVEDVTAKYLVSTGAVAQFLIPTNSLGTSWTQVGFDDSAWPTGTTALKFDRTSGPLSYDKLSGTDIERAMYGIGASVCVRIPFAGFDSSTVTDFQLLMRYEDGFVAYLNGQEIARRLAPTLLQWNSVASSARSNELALVRESINLIDRLSLLQPGTNVLAIQGLNRASADADFLLLPELVARNVRVLTNVHRYFATPTPGSANLAGLPGAAGPVEFSQRATTFVTPFQLVLKPQETAPGAVVRYTLDRTVPTESSPVYSGPLNISSSVLVRARVFVPGLFPGPVRSEGFIALSANVLSFSSDLPILIIHSFGGGRVNGTAYTGAYLTVHEPIRGRSALTNAPELVTRAAFKDRGSSTAGQAKANYAVELWDEDDQARNLPLLGMPAESDWVFHAPYNFDPALIRNPLACAMAHQLGRYASRYRFVEVYVNGATTTGPISSANYAGVYNILEKIKRSPDRVDIDELRPGDSQPPEVTGGYILKIDRLDPADTGLTAGGRSVALVEPKEAELKLLERAAQKKYITDYLNAFNTALSSAAFTNEVRGYLPYVDAESWIDHSLVDVLTWNVDALVLSSFFHKPRNGPIVYGPPWDYDRSLGSTDGRDANPRTWGNNFFTTAWWSKMFRDPNFWQKWIDRWQDVRQAQFSNQSFLDLIDSLAAQVAEAAPRDYTKWRQAKRGGTQQSEIIFTKNWLSNRLDFIDTNLLGKPILSHADGVLHPGFTLTMTGPSKATLYYTVNGTDPRLSGGQVSPSSIVYTGPIALTDTTVVTVRSRNPDHKNLTGGNNPPISSPWSGLTRARYSRFPSVSAGQLAVTEILFDPSAPAAAELKINPAWTGEDFEFIELRNVTTNTLDLVGVRWVSGIEFSFAGGGAETLGPGQVVLIVKNQSAFTARYGARPNIAGQFKGSLDNNGERLELVDAAGSSLFEFEYQPNWWPVTAGQGYSLVLLNPDRVPTLPSQRSDWRPSASPGGSPGTTDPIPALLPTVVVNEVLANTDRKDAIELRNPTASTANIGGWFLSDDRRVPKKFRIPDGTTVVAGGIVLFDEDDFNSGKGSSARFSFSRFGEEVYLFSADRAGNLLWYSHGFEFGPSDRETTFGRHVTSQGAEHLVAQTAATLGRANAGPKIGPVVISEVMYHPPDVLLNNRYWDNAEEEYVELQNISDQPVQLFDPDNPTNTWRLRSTVDFNFPTNVILPGQGLVLIVSFDPAANPAQLRTFRTRYGLNATTPILGPYTGKLDNSSGRLRLSKPGEPSYSEGNESAEIPYVLVDELEYGDESPWPAGADGLGPSLQRLSGTTYGDDPANWSAATATPGAANKRGVPPAFTRQPLSRAVIAGTSVTFAAQASGLGLVRYQWRFQGANLRGATNSTLTLAEVKLSDAGAYSVVALDSQGSVSSQPAVLSVQPGPAIAIQPQSRDVSPGTNVTFAATATGTGPLAFQWRRDGTNLIGATSASLTVTNVQLANGGVYTVAVTDTVGQTVSAPAVLTVLVRPQVTVQPESQVVLEGDRVVLRVAASGTPPLYYRWRRDGMLIANATNSVLTLPYAQLSDTATYSVIITNVPSVRSPVASDDALLVVLADFDRDRMADLWEAAHGLATNDLADARIDLDGDGFTNLQEYSADTDPRDQNSHLKFDAIKVDPLGITLEFAARSNRSYSVQFNSSALASSWLMLTNVPGQPTNRVATITDASPVRTNRFYRLITPAVP